jgi:hypothetical protein
MHFPELALVSGGHGRPGVLAGALVQGARHRRVAFFVEGEVHENQPDVLGISITELLADLGSHAAEMTLELAENHNGKPGVFRTGRGRTFQVEIVNRLVLERGFPLHGVHLGFKPRDFYIDLVEKIGH